MNGSRLLDGYRVAILVTDGFEESELLSPRKALKDAGATVRVVSPSKGHVRGLRNHELGSAVNVDLPLEKAAADDFDALVLPGGAYNADALRANPAAQALVFQMESREKPIAAICHAPWILLSTGLVHGRTLTSYPAIKEDLLNAGAVWLDREVVIDRNLLTSRKPADLPAFNRSMIDLFAWHASQKREGVKISRSA